MIKAYLHIIFLFCFPFLMEGQDTILTENFEAGDTPDGWTQEAVKPDGSGDIVEWTFEPGGHNGYPDTAAIDSLNARFFYASYDAESTRLITPPLNLEGKVKPEISFYHAMKMWETSAERTDELRVYYKKNIDSAWILLREYLLPVENWTHQKILIPDSLLSDNAYVAFEATTGLGHGVCIDYVQINETDIAPREVRDADIHATESHFVANGTDNNPVLRIDLMVYGNTGDALLNDLEITSLNQDDQDIALEGVRLYHTIDTVFNTTSPIGGGVSFSDSNASFSNLNYSLPTGLNSIWVTFDIAEDAQFGNSINASITSNAIKVNTDLFPEADFSPKKAKTIYEKIFYDTFEEDQGWNFTGEFERSAPLGKGGNTNGRSDPTVAFSGDTVIGTDLTGLNDLKGDYEANITDRAYKATSPDFNCFYYKDIALNFQQWLNTDLFDKAIIDISTDGGNTWENLWANSGFHISNTWTFRSIDISEYANRKKDVKIRFANGPSNGLNNYSGWNIDDIIITGDFIEQDAGVARRISPTSGTGLSSEEPVEVIVKNYGAKPTKDTIPLTYYFNNHEGHIVTGRDTIFSSISIGDSIHFTFKKKADLTAPGVYKDAFITTNMQGDEYLQNDSSIETLYVIPKYLPPYAENFENNNHFWFINGESPNPIDDATWTLSEPNGTSVNGTASGNKAWVTSASSHYDTNEYSYVSSPYIDLSGTEMPVIELSYSIDFEADVDGAKVQFSTDKKTTWQDVGFDAQPWDWNWYNNNSITSLNNTAGWSGRSSGWLKARQFLPNEAIDTLVAFRILIAGDSNLTSDEGIAFDDVRISDAPHDVGIVSIDSPITSCELSKEEQPIITLKNFGVRSIKAGELIPIGIRVNDSIHFDTLNNPAEIAVNDTYQFTFGKGFNMFNRGTYEIKAFTALKEDQNIYSDTSYNNDTSQTTISVNKPTVNLGPDIYTVHPDTIILDAYTEPGNSYTWQDNSTNSTFDVSNGGLYHVTVENNIPCTAVDTINIIQLIADVSIDSLINPASDCYLGESEQVVLKIKNAGTDTIRGNYTVNLNYTLNGTPIDDSILHIQDTIMPDSFFIFTFNETIDLSQVPANYTMSATIDYIDDMDMTNNTLTRTIKSYGPPSFDLNPNDTTLTGTQYKLDASKGNPDITGYLWEDGTTDSIFTVNYPGNRYFHVTVNDVHGCTNTDSSFVILEVPDIAPTAIIRPDTNCGKYATSQNTFQTIIGNVGYDTIRKNSSILVGYKIDTFPYNLDTILLSEDFAPGDTLFHDFERKDTVLSTFKAGVHEAYVFNNLSKDSAAFNDTLHHTFIIYDVPPVDLGDHQTLYDQSQYTLDAGPEFLDYLWIVRDDTVDYDRKFTVTSKYAKPQAKCEVYVTDTNQCQRRGEVFITLNFRDIAIINIEIPDSNCVLSEEDTLWVELANKGTYIIDADTFTYKFYVDNEMIEQGKMVTPPFTTQDRYFRRQIQKTLDINNGGNHSYAFEIRLSGDIVSANNFLYQNYYLKGEPTIQWSGGSDTVNPQLPYDAFPGAFQDYYWDNGSTKPTRRINNYGSYSVTVTDTKECQTSDTIYILESSSSIDNLKKTSVPFAVLYPNPANQYINIKIYQTLESPIDMTIYNIKGQPVHKQNIPTYTRKVRLDVATWSSGSYQIKFMMGEKTIGTKNIIIQ